MTLDILHFIDNKGGNASEIKESQRKRGGSVELVDEIIAMYTEWVKSECLIVSSTFSWQFVFFVLVISFNPVTDPSSPSSGLRYQHHAKKSQRNSETNIYQEKGGCVSVVNL